MSQNARAESAALYIETPCAHAVGRSNHTCPMTLRGRHFDVSSGSVELRMSVRPPYIRSALPPVSAVRLHSATLDFSLRATRQRVDCDEHRGFACAQPQAQVRSASCKHAHSGGAHADNVCNGQNEDLAVSDLASVRRHRDAPRHVVHLLPARMQATSTCPATRTRYSIAPSETCHGKHLSASHTSMDGHERPRQARMKHRS